MKRFPLLVALGAMMVLVALVFAACGGDDDDGENGETGDGETPTPASEELTGVTMGFIPIFIFAPVIVGVEEGYFAEEGIELTLERLAGGADMLVQTAAGNFDIGAGGVGVALFNLVGQAQADDLEIPVELVAPLHFEKPPVTTPLVVSKKRFDEGEITSVEDLRGLKVSINARGAATEYWLERALQSGGLTMADIDLQTVPFQDVAAALDNGGIDGAMLGEPFATLGEDQELVTVLTEDFVDGDQPTAVFWNREWAADNPELAEGFLRAYLKAVARLEDGGWEDDEVLSMIEEYTQVPLDVLKRAARPYHDKEGTLDIEGFQRQEAFFREQGLLTYDGELDFSEFTYAP